MYYNTKYLEYDRTSLNMESERKTAEQNKYRSVTLTIIFRKGIGKTLAEKSRVSPEKNDI